MEALMLVALVLFVGLWVFVAMYRLRGGQLRPPPVWILAVLLAVVVAALIVSVAIASWWTVVSFALQTIVFGALVFQAQRARRST